MKKFCCCLAVLGFATAALAGPGTPTLQTKSPNKVKATRMGELDAQGRLIGGWIEMGTGGIAEGACSANDYNGDSVITPGESFLFDIYEVDIDGPNNISGDGDDEFPTDGAVNDGYDPCCDLFGTSCAYSAASVRYFFGVGFCNPNAFNAFCVDPVYVGLASGRYNVAWFWQIDGVATSCEECFVILQVYESHDASCAGPPAAGFLGGAIYNIISTTSCDLDADGTGDELLQGGYYIIGLDLCFLNAGAGMTMPVDGCGSYQIIFGSDIIDSDGDGTLDTIVYPTCAQSMVWGDKGPNPGSQPNAVTWWDYLECEAPPVQPAGIADCTVDANGDGSIKCDTTGDGTFDGPFLGGTDGGPDGVHSAFCECFSTAGFTACPGNLNAMIALWRFVPTGRPCGTCGDNDCDGDVDSFDVAAFVQNLSAAVTWCSLKTCDRFCAGDGDNDGDIDAFDIANFIAALTAGGCPSPNTTGGTCP